MEKRLTCNVVQAHKRILEAHRLWHQALLNYFDPEGFRTNINASIQAMRNVSFAVQNEKHNIANYDTWYSEWQANLKNDEIMRWLCDARTDIVHKKDLEMYSTAIITMRCYETILKANLNIPLFLSGKAIIQYLLKENIINEKLKNLDAYATIERRWVVNNFPEYNVLYILGYGIGKLYLMVQEAHINRSIDIERCSVVDTIHKITIDENGIPACMNFTDQAMQETIGTKDFITRELSVKKMEINEKLARQSFYRYKKIMKDYPIRTIDNPFEFGECLFHRAKQILQKDGYHINIIYTQTVDLKWELLNPIFEDQVSKHIFWNDLARRVKKENIIAIIFIAECWVGKIDLLIKSGLRASEQPERKEALSVDIFTANIQGKSYKCLYHKNKIGKLVFSNEIVETNDIMNFNYIKPIVDVWKVAD